MTTTTASKQVWYVEFYHGYFGWLAYDPEFETREQAEAWLVAHKSPYKQRIRFAVPFHLPA